MTFPARRIALGERAPRPYATMFRLEGAIELAGGLRELLRVRASQIDGCAFCLDMHWKDARAAGESAARLYSLDAWRESPLYSERERTALELCEAITLVAQSHVPDDVWDAAAEHFDEDELAQLVFAITAINAWNRLLISARAEPGHYQPPAPAAAAGERDEGLRRRRHRRGRRAPRPLARRRRPRRCRDDALGRQGAGPARARRRARRRRRPRSRRRHDRAGAQ
jgi:AhpD family alkylhydroperoxidase